MSDTLGLPEAAHRLGVTIRTLRQAIRAGKLPAPPQPGATAILPAEWLSHAQAALRASPNLFTNIVRQKVPAFARYKGTSAWQKFRRRVREYAHYRAANVAK